MFLLVSWAPVHVARAGHSYQHERRDAAIWTVQNTNRNSSEIFDVVASAMANDWSKVREMIAQSRRQGAGLGQDLGIAYSLGAFLPDGSEAPIVNDPINDYKPSGRPGSRAPHLWSSFGPSIGASTYSRQLDRFTLRK
jgi:putative polyketide hydroxylase